MSRKRRTEITLETDRILVIRRGRLPEGWCEQCRKQVRMISLEEAIGAGLSQQAITRQAEAGRFHIKASGDEAAFICLNSILEQS